MQGGELQRTWRQFLLALGTDSCRPGIPETPNKPWSTKPLLSGSCQKEKAPRRPKTAQGCLGGVEGIVVGSDPHWLWLP